MPLRMLMVRCVLLITAAGVLLPQAARGDIIFNFNYADVGGSSGVGFDDPTEGATRRATMDAVAAYINTVVDHNGTVDFDVQASQTDGSGFLGQAGTSYFINPGYSNGFVFTHATTGVDPFAGDDGTIRFDFGYAWNSDTGGPGGGEFDLFTVALHEITHAMGFASLVTASGTSALTGSDPGPYSTFNAFMERGDGTDLFGPGGDYLGAPADLTSEDVFFNGPNATAANGGSPVELYAPATFAPGSSLSHSDHTVFVDQVMNFSIGAGETRRMYSAVELGILADLGWNVTAAIVPTPSAAGAGLVLLGLLVIRKRSRSDSAS